VRASSRAHAGASKHLRGVESARARARASKRPRCRAARCLSTRDESDGAQQKHLGWMFDASADSVFSFVSVCEVLGIDGDRLRARVRERLKLRGGPPFFPTCRYRKPDPG